MKYLVLCYYDVQRFEAMTKADLDAMIEVCKPWDEKFKATGKVDFVASQGMPKDWKCVRADKDWKPYVTNGPWVEAKEQVGAFFIVDAKDMDEALEVSMQHPGPHVARFVGGGIEIRACDFHEEPNKKAMAAAAVA